MSRKVSERKVINIVQDLSVAGKNNTKVDIDIGFHADECIVRQICYNTTEIGGFGGNIRCYQIYSDLADGQVLAVFPAMTSNIMLNTRLSLNKKFMKGSKSFIVQEIGTAAIGDQNATGTGTGPVSANAIGQYMLMLEFVRYE
jgi:hypothetical protein